MRVILNASVMFAPRAGIGQYVGELSGALQRRDDLQLLFTCGLHHGAELPSQGLRNYSQLSRLAKRMLPSPYELKRRIEQYALSRAFKAWDADLYHEPSLWPLKLDRPTVMTLHDLTHVHYPETQPVGRLRAIERHLGRALENSRQILCVSHFTAAQAMEHYGIPESKISVTPLGVSENFHPWSAEEAEPLLRGFGLSYRQYLLCVGTLEPRKNLELVFQAIRSLPRGLLERCPLVLCGSYGWGKLPESMAALLAERRVIHLGYRSSTELHALLASARILLFPSFYEGFGLPILEAMASGTPVVTSNCASMPEVSGGAAHLINPQDANDLSEAIQRLHDDQQYWHRLQQLGLERAMRFTWNRTAELTVAAYRTALQASC
ncbi:MAG: glycosyl transferase [Pseudomonas sp.]|nr:MAG: glycosyl transferase [Pseudomonas sp.]